jgi:hypothetical protein
MIRIRIISTQSRKEKNAGLFLAPAVLAFALLREIETRQ